MPRQPRQKVDVLDCQWDRFISNLEHLVDWIPCIEEIMQQIDLLPHARYTEEFEQTIVSQCSNSTLIMQGNHVFLFMLEFTPRDNHLDPKNI